MNMPVDDPFSPTLSEVGQRPERAPKQPARPTPAQALAAALPKQRTTEAGPPITITLPYPISANDYWGDRVLPPPKGSTRKPIVQTYVTPAARQYREDIGWLVKAAGIHKPFPWRVDLELWLYPHRPIEWATRMRKDPIAWDDTVRCIDVGNASKVLDDALQGLVYTNDLLIWNHYSHRMLPDERGARVVVKVTPHLAVLPASSPQGALL